MVYYRVDDGDTFLKKDFGIRMLRFHAAIYLKIEANVFFS